MARILLTGVAGFIGFHLCRRLIEEGAQVLGLDSLDGYYDTQLKRDRLSILDRGNGLTFREVDLSVRDSVTDVFTSHGVDTVIHMAAQAGVRYSLEAPHKYVESNLVGFMNLLECSRQANVSHFVYASSSSVYGDSSRNASTEGDSTDYPVSLYAATKKANEVMAHSYSHLYGLPTTGLRFFTVYGPWGRPDMAIYKFAEAICDERPIEIYNHGKMRRSFTYIDDVVEGVLRVADQIPQAGENDASDSPSTRAPYRLYNIGNDESVELETMISLLEEALGKRAIRKYLPLQPGDVLQTAADITRLSQAVGYRPQTSLAEGISKFAAWYLEYRALREKSVPRS